MVTMDRAVSVLAAYVCVATEMLMHLNYDIKSHSTG